MIFNPTVPRFTSSKAVQLTAPTKATSLFQMFAKGGLKLVKLKPERMWTGPSRLSPAGAEDDKRPPGSDGLLLTQQQKQPISQREELKVCAQVGRERAP